MEQANRNTDELRKAFGQLTENPKMATPCDRIRTEYRRSQVGDKLLISGKQIT